MQITWRALIFSEILEIRSEVAEGAILSVIYYLKRVYFWRKKAFGYCLLIKQISALGLLLNLTLVLNFCEKKILELKWILELLIACSRVMVELFKPSFDPWAFFQQIINFVQKEKLLCYFIFLIHM